MLITVERLKKWGACYFQHRPESTCECPVCIDNYPYFVAKWDAKQPRIAARLAWLGEGRTLQDVVENKEIPVDDRIWVVVMSMESMARDSPEYENARDIIISLEAEPRHAQE